MRRRTLLAGCGTAAAAAVATAAAPRLRQPPRLGGNILMLVVDDLNSWVGCLAGAGDGPKAITPAIDALARRGILLEHAYCPAPYCNASRMAVFSGCSPPRSGVYQDQEFWDRPQRPPTYLELLRRSGYTLLGAGKVLHGRYDYRPATAADSTTAPWLEMENQPFLWDRYAAMPPEPLPAQRPLHGIARYAGTQRPLSPQLDWGPLPEGRQAEQPDVLNTDQVIRWLERPPAQPLFCALGLYRPHLPWYVPQRYFDRYPLDQIQLPPVLADDLNDLPPLARRWASQPPDHATITAEGQWRQAVQAYLAAVSFADAQVGRVIAALQRSPIADDTTVVLWGDNGFHLGEKLHWRKFTLWEEATRVPLLIVPAANLSGAPKAQVVETPVSLVDLFPTLFALEGLEDPAGCDGRSLLPLLQGEERPEAARPALMSWQEGNHSLRWRHWRYIRYRDGSEELYNQRQDPHEWRNLAPAGGPVLKRLRAQLQQRLAGSER